MHGDASQLVSGGCMSSKEKRPVEVHKTCKGVMGGRCKGTGEEATEQVKNVMKALKVNNSRSREKFFYSMNEE